MSPIRRMARGTRPDRYITVPSRSALRHGMRAAPAGCKADTELPKYRLT
jgi:hypothetical protein